jgi:fructosamine-3-kinase
MKAATRQAVQTALGRRVASVCGVSGGDINRAYCLTLAGGERVFVKVNEARLGRMFAVEARGLSWLREAKAIRVPEVLGVGKEEEQESFLLLEWLDSAPPARGFDERLGRELAALHRAGSATMGWGCDNFIGSLPQGNAACATWYEFYWERRLLTQARTALLAHRIEDRLMADLSKLGARMQALVGPPEPASRLHGDLWSGNVMVGPSGEPCLVDPAVYGGHREVDLAMMRLFGGFGPRVFSAYDEVFPLSAGHQERVGLYQLYPLLVHVNLFGGGYAAQVRRMVDRYL